VKGGFSLPPTLHAVHASTKSIITAKPNLTRRWAFNQLAMVMMASSQTNQRIPAGFPRGGSITLGPCPGPTIEAAVVVTVTVAVEVFDPATVTELGETVHVAAVGAPLQLRETA
jgi:hypothetical protein